MTPFRFGVNARSAESRVDWAEYDEVGIPFDPASVRIDRLRESVQIIKSLLAGETVSFDGHCA